MSEQTEDKVLLKADYEACSKDFTVRSLLDFSGDKIVGTNIITDNRTGKSKKLGG